MVPAPQAAGVASSLSLPAARRPAAGKPAWGAAKAQPQKGLSVPPAATGQIQQLKEMGFSEQHAREALKECAWDVNKALDLLFTRGAPMDGEGGGNAAEASTEATSPVPVGKAGVVSEFSASSGNSPAGPDSTEQSTTASTASSPRSSAEKASGYVAGTSAPHSPLSIVETSGSQLATTVEEPLEKSRPKEEKAVQPIQEESAADSTEEVKQADAAQDDDKKLTLLNSDWAIEGEGAQLSVKKGDFVCIWQSSATDNGWIYAEDPANAERSGWLPSSVVDELPSNQRWMKAIHTSEAAHDTGLTVVEGTLYKVSTDSRTPEGWIYAEARATTDAEAPQAGWVPAFCLEGAKDL